MRVVNWMRQQTGMYKALVDSLGSVAFTVVGDDTALNWALSQVTLVSCHASTQHVSATM